MTDSNSNIATLIPGPSFQIELSAHDARHPIHYSRRLLIFRCTGTAQSDAQLAALKTGLQALVKACPLLGGIIIPLSPDEANSGQQTGEDWRTIVPDQGIELIVRDLRTAVASFEELKAATFPTGKFPYNLFVPVPHDLKLDQPFPACKIQFSIIDGGTILTWAMSHSVSDGQGNNELIRLLAEETRSTHQQSSLGVMKETPFTAKGNFIGQDRSLLRNMSSDILFNLDHHPAYMSYLHTNAPPPQQLYHHPFQANSPEISVLLQIPPTKLAKLKANATSPSGPRISTHDALAALIWRSTLLIRSRRSSQSLPQSTKTSIFLPSDARRSLELPSSYVGNAVYQLTASLDLGTLLSSSGLQAAATALRSAILAVKPELVKSYMAELRERWVDWRFTDGSVGTTGVAMGTDWTSGEVYDQEWGEAFGKVLRFRYPGEEGGAFNCVLPKLPDGAAEVMVAVMPNESEILKGEECFGLYLESGTE